MNLTWKIKAIIIAVVMIIIGLLGFIIKYQHDLIAKNQIIEKSVVEFRQLKDDIVRNQSQWASKDDIDKFIKSNGTNLDEIKKDLSKLGAKVDSVSVIVANSSGYKGKDISSTGTEVNNKKPELPVVKCRDGETVECPSQDTFGYVTNKQYLRLNEVFKNTEVPFGDVGFDASAAKPWSVEVYPRSYKVATILGVDDGGRHYAYSKFTLESNNKSYPITIDDAKFLEEYPDAKFRFGAYPYLGLSVGTTVNKSFKWEMSPSLEIFLFSYGKTVTNPTWTFLGLGIGYETQSHYMNFMLSPFEYNIGNDLPLINNLFIGPSLSVNANVDINAYVNLKLGL